LKAIGDRQTADLPDGALGPGTLTAKSDLLQLLTAAEQSEDGMKALIKWIEDGIMRERRREMLDRLKQVFMAVYMYADSHDGALPASFEVLLGQELKDDRILINPFSGKRFVYIGAGQRLTADHEIMIAYSPGDGNGCTVLYGDGSTASLTIEHFTQALKVQQERAQH
jgi:hypothetical protein